MAQLYYIVGASGAGKDSLMNYARKRIDGNLPVAFAHRYITRAPKEGNENHIFLSPEEFALRLGHGLFAMHWESHGQYYGIGREIDVWRESGLHVVINGSREYLSRARSLYPELQVVVVTADPELISQRLLARGRENAQEIEARISRGRQLVGAARDDSWEVPNNGPLEEAGELLLGIVSGAVTVH